MYPFRSNFETSFFVTGNASTAIELSIKLNGSVPFTVSAWVKVQSVQDAAQILTKGDVFAFGVQGKSLYVAINGFPTLISNGSTNPITQDEWHYVCCVFTGSMLQLYIDGNLDTQAGVSGSGADNSNAFFMANNFQGSLNSVRIFDTALSAGAILEAMFQPDPTQQYVANFDFTLNPPRDTSGNNLPLTLNGNAVTKSVAPAVSLLTNAYCQPINDGSVNPGGAGNDAYTIQSWVWIERPTASLTEQGLVPDGQAIFVNQALDAASGIALYLEYDSAASAYRAASLRGNIGNSSNILRSVNTIPFGQWVNIATTYDPATVTLAIYINAGLDVIGSSFPAIPALPTPSILIGGAIIASQPSAGWALQGYIQTVDIWNIALAQAQIQQWQNDYPVMEDGLTAHYDFSNQLTSNENNGAPVGLSTRAVIASQSANAIPSPTAAAIHTSEKRAAAPHDAPYAQLPADEMAKIRAGITFADIPDLDKLLEAAMRRDLQAHLPLLLPEAMVPQLQSRLEDEWQRVRKLVRERPLELRFLITYHKIDGEHVLIHHTPVRSTVVFRASLDVLDDCTMWRIRIIWTILMGMLSVFGVTASLTNKALQFIQTRILGNAALMRAIGNIPASISAGGLFTIIGALYSYGVLWPLIKIVLTTMGWWALGKLLVKILVKFFGAAVAIAETLVSLVIAVAQLIIVITQQPQNCPLIPPSK